MAGFMAVKANRTPSTNELGMPIGDSRGSTQLTKPKATPKYGKFSAGDRRSDLHSDLPPPWQCKGDYQVQKLCSDNTYKWRRMVYTEKNILFTHLEEISIIDIIPLEEITRMPCWEAKADTAETAQRTESLSTQEVDAETIDERLKASGLMFEIHTTEDGYNSGRAYRLVAASIKQRSQMTQDISVLSKAASELAKNLSFWEKKQEVARNLYHSLTFQIVVAFLIFLNFLSEIAATTWIPEEGSSEETTFLIIDIIFTVIFAIELGINAFGHWLWPFITDGWSMLDLFVVCIGLLSYALSGVEGITVLRLFRAFRILRIFGRLKALRQITKAIVKSIVPVVNAFLILFIIMAIYAIIGVNFFREESPDAFGDFGLGLYAMFQLSAGQTWIESLPAFDENNRSNYGTIFFIGSYIIIANWTLLQVSVAVLLDRFVQATTEEKEIEAKEREESNKWTKTVKTVISALDPLLHDLIHSYRSEAELRTRIDKIYSKLDHDGSGTLSCEEMSIGLKKMDYQPHIRLSAEDLDTFFLDADIRVKSTSAPDITPESFNKFVRVQLKEYSQRQINNVMIRSDPNNTILNTQMTFAKLSLMALDQNEVHTQKLYHMEAQFQAKMDLILNKLGLMPDPATLERLTEAVEKMNAKPTGLPPTKKHQGKLVEEATEEKTNVILEEEGQLDPLVGDRKIYMNGGLSHGRNSEDIGDKVVPPAPSEDNEAPSEPAQGGLLGMLGDIFQSKDTHATATLGYTTPGNTPRDALGGNNYRSNNTRSNQEPQWDLGPLNPCQAEKDTSSLLDPQYVQERSREQEVQRAREYAFSAPRAHAGRPVTYYEIPLTNPTVPAAPPVARNYARTPPPQRPPPAADPLMGSLGPLSSSVPPQAQPRNPFSARATFDGFEDGPLPQRAAS